MLQNWTPAPIFQKTLKAEKLVLDWCKKERALADVRRTIEMTFDDGLPQSYGMELYDKKCEAAFHHILNNYYGGESVYAA